MLPDLSVPPHWPVQVPNEPCDTEQSAVRALARARLAVVDHYIADGDEERAHHARTSHIVNVVAGLIADVTAIESMYLAQCKKDDIAANQLERLRDDLADMKRPMSAQMEMQNRRIIALTAEVDRLKGLLDRRGSGT